MAGPSQTDTPTNYKEAVTPRQPGLVSLSQNPDTPTPQSRGRAQPVRDVEEGGSPGGDLPECQGGANSDQGEDKADDATDGTAMPEVVPARRGTQVVEQDRKEHLLAAGKWFGLSAVRKANEIYINVSETLIA